MFADVAALIAERKIREALERGEFDNLPLKGQPITVEDLSMVPAELRMGFKILKNAGCLPQELQLRRDMLTLQDLLLACLDEEERAALKKKLSQARLQYDLLAEKHRRNPAFHQYAATMTEKLGI